MGCLIVVLCIANQSLGLPSYLMLTASGERPEISAQNLKKMPPIHNDEMDLI